MKPMHIAMALLSAAMFFVLAGVFMGVQLELDGTKLVVDSASDVRWQWVFIGTAVVFFFQLLRPAFFPRLKEESPHPLNRKRKHLLHQVIYILLQVL